jgi:hypothetical protein
MSRPDGVYAARAITGALGVSGSGKEQIGIEFEIQDQEGGHVTWYGFFTEKTTERTIETLRICGWHGTDLSSLDGIGDNEVSIVLETEEWEGKARQKVQWVNRAGGLSMANPLNADQAKAFAAKMRGAVLAFDQKSGTPKAKKETSQKPPF